MPFLALQVLGATAAQAQSQDAKTDEAARTSDQGLGDIVVTAQRRTEDLQRAALSITAVSGDKVIERGVTQVEQLATLAPGLQVNTSAGPYASFSIRSVSSLSGNAFADSAVAMNYDGVYLATPTILNGLYYDLERVEILKGPQGTLYGRNATAGAINVIPRKPEFTTGGDANLQVGNLGRFNIGGAINVAAKDTVAVRFAGQHVRRDGFMSDGTSDDNGDAVRGSILIEPTPDLSILMMADYSHQGGRGPGATIRKECAKIGLTGGACFVADPYTGIADLASEYTSVGEAPPTQNQFIDGDYGGALLNIDYRTAIGTLTFLGAYREAESAYVGTGTSWQLRETQKPRQTSGELRLASDGGGALQYVFGLYYLSTTMDSRSQSESLNNKRFSDSFTHNEGWTWATFSQLTYSVSDVLRLTGGLRYTYEQKKTNSQRYNLLNTVGPDPVIPDTPSGVPTIDMNLKKSWDAVNWKAGIEFDAAPESLLYANVSTGFKAGGFYYGPPGANTYEPEHVTSYAIGSKNRFANDRIELNIEGYYLDYTDQQVSFVKLVGPGSVVLVTENAGKTTAYGVDVDSQFLLGRDTRIGLSGSWVHARYDQFDYDTVAPPSSTTLCTVGPPFPFNVDCSGLQPFRTPEWTVTGTFDQSFDLADGGRVFMDALGQYKSAFYADTSYQIETLTNESFRANFGLGYEDPQRRYRIRAFVDNAFDEVTISNATVNTAYSQNNIVGVNLLAPRTYGIQASANF
ncbi:TonB-dependent receptor [Croceibacterium aestuarii]|uniref:TonB-dependent receptor n=1 Tax=Croceibacterium aestuarii TaxID=3064139 RepID=UPI00272E602C|nr:TonB-dependent receptor [Croceibacterium sp. D39]